MKIHGKNTSSLSCFGEDITDVELKVKRESTMQFTNISNTRRVSELRSVNEI